MEVFYAIWKKYNEVQLKKIDLNNRKIKNPLSTSPGILEQLGMHMSVRMKFKVSTCGKQKQ